MNVVDGARTIDADTHMHRPAFEKIAPIVVNQRRICLKGMLYRRRSRCYGEAMECTLIEGKRHDKRFTGVPANS